MERGGGFHRYRKHAKQPAGSAGSSSGMSIVQADNSSNNDATNFPNAILPACNTNDNTTGVPVSQQAQTPQCIFREQDQYMPIANVIRIMRRILPPHAKISDDAKETIQECVSEYISFITGEANERCQSEQRKTITAEDLIWAMGKLGFDNYVEPLTLFLNRYRETENDRSSLRDPILKRGHHVDYGNVGMHPYLPTFPGGEHQGIFNHQGVFNAALLGGYYGNASSAPGTGGGSSSQNAFPNFDPYGQFK